MRGLAVHRLWLYVVTPKSSLRFLAARRKQSEIKAFFLSSLLPDLNRRLFAYHANTLPTELKRLFNTKD